MIKKNINIANARIGFRNFSGKEGRYNPLGKRNFCVFLEPDIADTLRLDGWNVRWLEPRDDQAEPQGYLQVAVSFDSRPPKIEIKTSGGITRLDEESVSLLDWADIASVDLIIRPYNWEVNGKGGVKAYIKTMYITIEEDEFEAGFYNSPDSAERSVIENGD